MFSKTLKNKAISISVMAIFSLSSFAASTCKDRTVVGTWDGIAFTSVQSPVPFYDFSGSCRLTFQKGSLGIGIVTGTCNTVKSPNVPLQAKGIYSLASTCNIAISGFQIDGGPDLTLVGTVSGQNRDYMSGTYLENETFSGGIFSLTKMR